MTNENQIIQGILNVERSTIRYSTPNGRYPVCVPSIDTGFCERCGKDVTSQNFRDPCESVTPDQRWDVKTESPTNG